MATGKQMALEMLLKLKDELSGQLKGPISSLGELGNAAAKAGKAAAMGIGIASGAILGLAANAAKVDVVEQSFSNLAASIGETKESMLNALRPAVMGTMSDFELMQAGSKLMAMGLANSAEEAAKLAQMAVTLGTAMGEDAGSALENFTLMLANQSIPRLDTFGISSGQVRQRIEELMAATEGMTRDQAFMIAVMEQGEIAMQKVGDVSGSTAITMGSLKANMENLTNQLGQAFLPILQALLTPLVQLAQQYGPQVVAWAQQLVALFQGLPEPVQQVIAVVMGLSAAFAGASAALTVLGPMLPALGTALGALTGPIGIVVAAVAGLALAWATNFMGIRDKTEVVVNWIKGFIDQALAFIQDMWEEYGEEITATAEAAWELIREVVRAAMEFIQSTVQTVAGAIVSFWQSHGDQIKSIAETAWNYIKETIHNILTIIQGIIQTMTALIHGDWEGAWEGIKTVTEGIWEQIKDTVNAALELIKGIIDLGWSVVKDLTAATWDSIKGLVGGALGGMKRKVSQGMNQLGNRIESAWQSVHGRTEYWWNNMRTTVFGIVRSWWDDYLKGPMNRLKNKMLDAWEAIKSGIQGMFEGFNIHIPLPHFSINWEDIGFGIRIPHVSVQWYGFGGEFIARGPMLIGVGERGPERVIIQPLGAEGNGGGGGTVQYILNYTAIRNDAGYKDAARAMRELELLARLKATA